MAEVLRDVTPETLEIARDLAALPLTIRGFGPIKEANAEAAKARRAELLTAFRAGGAPATSAAA